MRFWATLKKELRALARDVHALAALFLMPAIFILVMSLALQNTLAPESARRFAYAIDDRDGSALARAFGEKFAGASHFTRTETADVAAALRTRRLDFAIALAPGFGRRLTQTTASSNEPLVRVTAEPGVPAAVLAAARAQTEYALAQLGMEQLAQGIGVALPPQPAQLVASGYFEAGTSSRPPTAVQQSVPAWLIFAMFFIVIPLSTIFITEREYGTLKRLHAMGVSSAVFFGGKVVPFFLVNQVQAGVMLLVGIYVLPLFGADALTLDGSLAALALVLAATSLAAIGYALLVAVSAATIAQATIVGGVGNILLGAIGGVMAPKFLMPPAMQKLAELSPMGWALDGMFDVLLRGAGAGAVAGRAALLLAFAAACLGLAALVFQRRRRHA